MYKIDTWIHFSKHSSQASLTHKSCFNFEEEKCRIFLSEKCWDLQWVIFLAYSSEHWNEISSLSVQLFFGLVAVTFAGVVHQHSEVEPHQHDGEIAETEHHHHINHKHAESHQQVKFIHYHPVPVYVKKEDQKYLHHPVEIGANKLKLKLVHPETSHAKGHGLELENHSEHISHKIGHHEYKAAEEPAHHDIHVQPEVYENQSEYDFASYEAAHH